MSYGLFIFTTESVPFRQAADIAASLNARILTNGGSASGFVVERKEKSKWSYGFELDGPLKVEHEDLPGEVAERAPASRWLYEVRVGAPTGVEITLGKRFAQQFARAGGGVVFDPQEDVVIWPRRRARPPSTQATRGSDALELRWYVRREDIRPDLPEILLEVLNSRVPDALPRRFGDVEPLQYRMSENGPSAFAALWRNTPLGISWLSSRSSIHGGTIGLAADIGWRGDVGAHPIGWIHLTFDDAAIVAGHMLDDLVEAFTVLAEGTGSFYAYAGLNRWLDRNMRVIPSPMHLWRWMGIPPANVWLAWFGRIYRPEIEEHLPLHRTTLRAAGLVFRQGEAPEPPLVHPRGLLSLVSGTLPSKRGLIDYLPKSLLMKPPEAEGDGPERAEVIPEGL